MTGQELEPSWPRDVLEALKKFKQGDLIKDPPMFFYGAVEGGLPSLASSPSERRSSEEEETGVEPSRRQFEILELEFEGDVYGVITSQTCDLSEEGEPAQPFFQAVPGYRLGDEFRKKILPGYLVPLAPPDLPPAVWVADLRIEVPIEKTLLVHREPIAGFLDEDGYLAFASALGRRRDRAALGAQLVDAVAATLRKRMSNNKKFGEVVKSEIQSVRLNISRGTRLAPVEARVHVVARGPISDGARERFEKWWDGARAEAEAMGIHLLPNEYHDSTHMNVEEYERLIDLGIV
jgi:hypothetical protein